MLGSQPSRIKPNIPHILVMEVPKRSRGRRIVGTCWFSAWGVGEGHKEAPGPERQSDRLSGNPLWPLGMYASTHACTDIHRCIRKSFFKKNMSILVHGNSFSDFDFRVDSQKYNKHLRRLGQTSHGLRATAVQFTFAFT